MVTEDERSITSGIIQSAGELCPLWALSQITASHSATQWLGSNLRSRFSKDYSMILVNGKPGNKR